MLAKKLADLGVSPGLAKMLLVAAFTAVTTTDASLIAAGYITGFWAIIAVGLDGFLAAVAVLIDPNAGHA